MHVGGEAADAAERRAVDRARLRIRVVVREVGGDDDEGLGSAPEPLDHFGDFVDPRIADGEGREREVAELALQERQLHLERVLLQVGPIARHDLRQSAHLVESSTVDRDGAQRRGECFVARNR